MCTGDFPGTRETTEAIEFALREFAAVADRVAVVPGNHDQSATVAEVYARLMGEPCSWPTTLEVGPARVILLDTSEGYFGQHQLAYLRGQTGGADGDKRQVLVFAHHPPCTLCMPFLDRDFAAADVAEATNLLSAVAAPVRFFCGHYHLPASRTLGKAEVHCTAGVCFTVHPDREHMEITRAEAGLRTIDIDPDTGQVMTRHEYASLSHPRRSHEP